MDASTLYLIAICHMGGPPCPAPLFTRNVDPHAFQYTRDECLAHARAEIAPKVGYCAGNDGSTLAASGRIVPVEEYYNAVDDYRRATATPLTSSTAR